MVARQVEIHPGEILKEEFLGPRGMSAWRLARDCDLPEETITDLIEGLGSINQKIAGGLGRALGTTQGFWVALQRHYDAERLRGDLLTGAKSPLAGKADDAYFGNLRAGIHDEDGRG